MLFISKKNLIPFHIHADHAVIVGRSPLIKERRSRRRVDGWMRESCRKEVIVHTKKLFLVSVLLLQALVLVFAVLVQVAIVGQWFYGEPPAVIQVQQQQQAAGQSSSASTSCKTPLGQIVASLG